MRRLRRLALDKKGIWLQPGLNPYRGGGRDGRGVGGRGERGGKEEWEDRGGVKGVHGRRKWEQEEPWPDGEEDKNVKRRREAGQPDLC